MKWRKTKDGWKKSAEKTPEEKEAERRRRLEKQLEREGYDHRSSPMNQPCCG